MGCVLYIPKTGEQAMLTTIANLGAIAGKCEPDDDVQVDWSVERVSPSVGPSSSRATVTAGSVVVEVTRPDANFGENGPQILRDAARALCRIVAKRTPKPSSLGYVVDKRTTRTVQTKYRFNMRAK